MLLKVKVDKVDHVNWTSLMPMKMIIMAYSTGDEAV